MEAAQADSFVYQNLPTSCSLRLLKLSDYTAAGPEAVLYYTLADYNLEDLPPYVALSYTW